MRLAITGVVASCLALTQAFKDTSPFVLFSTSEIPSTFDAPSYRQLEHSRDVLRKTKDLLSSCPSDQYIIVSQPGVHATDFATSKSTAVLFRKAFEREKIGTRTNVPEVVGEIDAEDLQNYIQSHCDADVVRVDLSVAIPELELKSPQVIRADFPNVPSAAPKRKAILQEHDMQLDTILNSVRGSRYTVIYTTTPPTDVITHSTSYEPSFVEPLHTEMKRQFNLQRRADEDNTNSTVPSNAPLFEKYQFLTPGLFMSFLVGLILLAILAVGINAVASLQVSYGAFDKEMGPAAQKKQ